MYQEYLFKQVMQYDVEEFWMGGGEIIGSQYFIPKLVFDDSGKKVIQPN